MAIFMIAWNHRRKNFPPFFGHGFIPTAKPSFSTCHRPPPDSDWKEVARCSNPGLARTRICRTGMAHGDGLTNLLAEMGFAYTTRLGEIIPLLPGLNKIKPSQSLCYSTRAGWRRFASGVWNKYLYAG